MTKERIDSMLAAVEQGTRDAGIDPVSADKEWSVNELPTQEAILKGLQSKFRFAHAMADNAMMESTFAEIGNVQDRIKILRQMAEKA